MGIRSMFLQGHSCKYRYTRKHGKESMPPLRPLFTFLHENLFEIPLIACRSSVISLFI